MGCQVFGRKGSRVFAELAERSYIVTLPAYGRSFHLAFPGTRKAFMTISSR